MQRGSRPLTIGYTAKVGLDKAVGGYNADIATNLPGGTGNTLNAYLTEDGRIQTVDWNVVHLGSNYLASMESGWLWNVRGQMQYSGTALISGEQFGLGGAASVRDTGERILSGDSGASMKLERTTPEVFKGLRLRGVVDGR